MNGYISYIHDYVSSKTHVFREAGKISPSSSETCTYVVHVYASDETRRPYLACLKIKIGPLLRHSGLTVAREYLLYSAHTQLRNGGMSEPREEWILELGWK